LFSVECSFHTSSTNVNFVLRLDGNNLATQVASAFPNVVRCDASVLVGISAAAWGNLTLNTVNGTAQEIGNVVTKVTMLEERN